MAVGGVQKKIQSPGLGLCGPQSDHFALAMSAWLRSERHCHIAEGGSRSQKDPRPDRREHPDTHQQGPSCRATLELSRTRRVDRFVTVALSPRVLPLLCLPDRTRIPPVESLRSECVTRGPSTAVKMREILYSPQKRGPIADGRRTRESRDIAALSAFSFSM